MMHAGTGPKESALDCVFNAGTLCRVKWPGTKGGAAGDMDARRDSMLARSAPRTRQNLQPFAHLLSKGLRHKKLQLPASDPLAITEEPSRGIRPPKLWPGKITFCEEWVP